MVGAKPVASSMDNLQTVGKEYPTPDYSGPGSPASVDPTPSTLSFPQVGIAIPNTMTPAPTLNQTVPTSPPVATNGMGKVFRATHDCTTWSGMTYIIPQIHKGDWAWNHGLINIKTSFNIILARFKQLLNFDACVVHV